jgi:hypothetical protein
MIPPNDPDTPLTMGMSAAARASSLESSRADAAPRHVASDGAAEHVSGAPRIVFARGLDGDGDGDGDAWSGARGDALVFFFKFHARI